ncbi:MAG: PmoA family protein [Planctomycetota bacterium]
MVLGDVRTFGDSNTPPELSTMPAQLLLALAGVLAAGAAFGPGAPVAIRDAGEGRFDVAFGDRLFTTLHTKGFPKPILYPIVGPHGVRMTRDYPMKPDTPGEARDHPHQQSLWFTHGDVNGVDFWALGRGRIVTREVEKPVSEESRASIVLHDDWVGPDGKIVCTDTQRITFHAPIEVPGGEAIALDYEITIHASHGDVVFGDTKEGTMAIRTHPKLEISKGAAAVNSEGVKGKDVWGKRAKWVDYSAEIDGKTVGVAIFDHPSNIRHPTWWHARDYGLVAANPFGIHDFEGKPKKEGDWKVAKKESVKFTYRFVFHSGDAESARIASLYAEWAK